MAILLLEGKVVPCTFCEIPSVGKYKTPEGCVCRPNDREQTLCGQHVIRDGMIGDKVELLEIYNLSFYRWYFGNDTVEEFLVSDLAKGGST